MSRKGTPEQLQEQQEAKRKETVNLVQNAINELKVEGCKVTMNELVERTGLARSTLSKKHVQEVLKNNKVCKFEKVKVSEIAPKSKSDFELALQDAMVKLNTMSLENEQLKNRNNALRVENYELKETNAKLRGELQALSQKARLEGVRLELIK